jgi:hypothetical protein
MHLLDRTQYLKESIARHEKRNPFSCRTPRICCSFRCPAFVSVVALLSVSDLYMSGNEMSAKWWRCVEEVGEGAVARATCSEMGEVAAARSTTSGRRATME